MAFKRTPSSLHVCEWVDFLFLWRNCQSIIFYVTTYKVWRPGCHRKKNGRPPSGLLLRETIWFWPLLNLNLIHSSAERWCFHRAWESRPEKSSLTQLSHSRAHCDLSHGGPTLKKCFCKHQSRRRHLAGSHQEKMCFLDDVSLDWKCIFITIKKHLQKRKLDQMYLKFKRHWHLGEQMFYLVC